MNTLNHDPLFLEIGKLRQEVEDLKCEIRELRRRAWYEPVAVEPRVFVINLGLTCRTDSILALIFKNNPRSVQAAAIAKHFTSPHGRYCALKTVHVHVRNIRKTLQKTGISLATDHSFGYRLDDENYEKLKKYVI
jgi:DNA-binding response OmpR family regulator